MRKTIMIGLTGPTGAGKSALKQAAEQCRCGYIDCDSLSRNAVEPGSPALARLAESFGDDIIRQDGSLDRAELARRAFPTQQGRDTLNSIVHPAVIALVEESVEQFGRENIPAAIVDAPTLFESGLDSRCDSIVAVVAPDQCRLERIMARDGLTEEAAMIRMNAQHPCDFYSQRAQHTIVNDGTVEELVSKGIHVLEQIIKGENL